MTKKIIFMGLSALAITLAGCSWTDRQIGPNEYEISGYFDFTMKGEVVVKGLEDQARLYYITDKNRIFDYEAQRASAVIRFHCIPDNGS